MVAVRVVDPGAVERSQGLPITIRYSPLLIALSFPEATSYF
jgi:hypothetical protein